MATSMLTAARLREVLHYDQETGAFTWRVRLSNCIHAGDTAGHKHSQGYIYIRVDGRPNKAHRLAWLYVTGCWPTKSIDHIDGKRDNNSWSNLRDVSRSMNSQNMRNSSRKNKSGLIGVTAHGRGWCAQIKESGKYCYLGTFDTPELAHAAYVEAKRELHPGCTI